MLVSAAGMFAQEQAPAQPQPPAQPAAATQAPKSTLTGCVVQAKTTDGGTAYVLNKAEGGSATMYVLGGSSQTDWSTNVNKKVEVTGPVQEPPNANKDSAPDPKVLRPPLIVVESTKVVAQSCT
jgi:nucleoid-associated protein YgaU